MSRVGALLAGVAALGLAACQQAESRSTFDARVRAYLMAHPDDLKKAIANMQAKEDADEARSEAAAYARGDAALPSLRAAVERDSRDFVANPNGKVTVTEFYDYRCPHCISVAPKVVALIHSNPDVRFVFKEWPIFGSTSDHAARVALAAKAQGKDYVGLYEAFMAARPLTDDEVDRLASAKGVSLAQIGAPATQAKNQAQLDDVANLAAKLGILGTPGFVVGNKIIRGDDAEAVAAAVAAAQKKA